MLCPCGKKYIEQNSKEATTEAPIGIGNYIIAKNTRNKNIESRYRKVSYLSNRETFQAVPENSTFV